MISCEGTGPPDRLPVWVPALWMHALMAGIGRRSRRACVVTAVVLGFWEPGCAGPSGPGFSVVCPAIIFVGQTSTCVAFVTGSETQLAATWTSSDPSIASFGPLGALKGRSAGQVVATATYEGRSESASVSVRAEDVLQVLGAAYQGLFKTGNTVTMVIAGFYGVASADSGQLNLVVTDQNEVVVSSSEPQIVPRGGDSFGIYHSLTIPIGTTRICRTAVLRIGFVTLTATGSSQVFPCLDVAQ